MLWVLQEKWVSLIASCTGRKAKCLLTALSFPPQMDSPASSFTQLCHFKGRGSCFFYSKFLKTWTSTKALLSVGICQAGVFQVFPDHSCEGLEPMHRLLLIPQPILEFVYPISNSWQVRVLLFPQCTVLQKMIFFTLGCVCACACVCECMCFYMFREL